MEITADNYKTVQQINQRIAEYLGVKPTEEYCVGETGEDSISFCPSHWEPHPPAQKIAAQKWIDEQVQRGFVKSGHYEIKKYEWYPYYNNDFNALMRALQVILEKSPDCTICTYVHDTDCHVTVQVRGIKKPLPHKKDKDWLINALYHAVANLVPQKSVQ
jgi:hypothetical protein